jgi:tRNA(fMet)-specific endonuclease VapC
MAKFILDTCILLHYVRGTTLALHVENQYSPSVPPNYSVISVVSQGEILSLAFRRKWGVQKQIALKKLLLDAYRLGKHPEKLLPDGESSKSIGDNDLWIASTASVLKSTLLTTDKDFMVFDTVFLDVVYLDPEQFKEKH